MTVKMIHIVFHGVQCTTLYCAFMYLMMMGSSKSSTIIINHQSQPKSDHQPTSDHQSHHQGIYTPLITTTTTTIIVGLALSCLCLIRIIYSSTLLSNRSTVSTRLSSTGGELLSNADNIHEQMGVSSWIYMLSMFVLFNISVIRYSVGSRTTTTTMMMTMMTRRRSRSSSLGIICAACSF